MDVDEGAGGLSTVKVRKGKKEQRTIEAPQKLELGLGITMKTVNKTQMDDDDDEEDEATAPRVLPADWKPPDDLMDDDDLDDLLQANEDDGVDDDNEDDTPFAGGGEKWDEEAMEALKADMFVTGKNAWEKPDEVDPEAAAKGEGVEEKKKKKKSKTPVVDSAADAAGASATNADGEFDKEAYLKMKAKKKAEFDDSYDNKKSGGGHYVDQIQAKLEKEATRVKEKYEQLDDLAAKVKLMGYFEGLYVRVVLERVPPAFLKTFRKSEPVLLGGLNTNEDKLGFVYCRIKKHRWHGRILKSNDPVTLSLGWRRFQTLPIYAIEDQNGRHRYLKYTPEHMHCMCVFWGPVTPPNNGLVAFQDVMDDSDMKFRAIASGYSMQADDKSCVVKKLRLTGVPLKVSKNTAFIKNMFNSPVEVAMFEGAGIRTVSQIRGVIKKAIPGKNGIFRATFQDKILMSDIVTLRTWKAVQPGRLFNPVGNRLGRWRQMKTQNALRKEQNIPIPNKADSRYQEAKRAHKQFNQLKVPQSLLSSLPYQHKRIEGVLAAPLPSKKDREISALTAVVPTASELKAQLLLNNMADKHKQKVEKQRKKDSIRHHKHQAELKAKEDRITKHMQEAKKKRARSEGKRKAASERATKRRRKG
eukprot:NODE_183_length_2395_cov_23.454145_g178_i0.p1 GENE.NODE_183_length_2395_cov_23.454145_g178_i0~~NODE_183_length_2395_cov_23.454145_g178_i0.p1  ORF type:complete len:731 (+),score=264.71 NODE_183_length_2395_cov_23.454145_g178_i0:271-2193(+)